MLIQACLNGTHRPGAHPRLPVTAEQLAADAAACAAAGAGGVHIHPRDANGSETLAADAVAAACAAVRSRAPDLPIGVSTAAWIEPSLERRLALIAGWREPPDLASVNLHEDGSLRVIDMLNEMGIGVEAGVWTENDAHLLVELGLDSACSRILVEVQGDQTPDGAVQRAAAIDAILDDGQVMAPRLHHAEAIATWAVIDAAIDNGHDARIGLEDTLVDERGAPAADNETLVRAAVARVNLAGRAVEMAARA